MVGTHEQIMVAHVMEFAMCVGDYTEEDHCISAGINSYLSSAIFIIYLLLKVQ